MSFKYLNLGCGTRFNTQWINVDFIEAGNGVIVHNLLDGLPFDDNTFEVVYHSHVLEHFPKGDALKFIKECYRVLEPNGIIRIAVPDLEQIVANYNRLLTLGKADLDNKEIRADYDWIIIEMYDQTVRDKSGGEMLNYLAKPILNNENFIYSRIGHEGRMLRKSVLNPANPAPVKRSPVRKLLSKIKSTISPKNYKESILKTFFKKEYDLLELARFKRSGEIHQWMYDVYSLANLLKDAGFKDIQKKTFDESNIANWRSFELDEIEDKIRKPDSLFVEAFK